MAWQRRHAERGSLIEEAVAFWQEHVDGQIPQIGIWVSRLGPLIILSFIIAVGGPRFLMVVDQILYSVCRVFEAITNQKISDPNK
jgi:hypothetical protein